MHGVRQRHAGSRSGCGLGRMPRRQAYSLAASVLRLARRAFPTQARARASQLLFEWLNLTWKMPSGVQL